MKYYCIVNIDFVDAEFPVPSAPMLNPSDNSVELIGYYYSSTVYEDWSVWHFSVKKGPASGHIKLVGDGLGSNGRFSGYSVRPISK